MKKLSFPHILWACAPMLLAVALYGYTVYLPFFLDDGLLLEIILRPQHSPLSWEIWGGSMTFAYYRPLVFTLWEINQSLMEGGRFDPIGLHWLNVMCYGMTGVLLGAWLRRVGRWFNIPNSATWSGVAGIVYVLFPFNYNAVMWVASMFHIMAGFGTMLAVWCATIFLTSNKHIDGMYVDGMVAIPTGRFIMLWLIGAWLGVFIAVFSHENGVLLAPLMGVYLFGIWVMKTTSPLNPLSSLERGFKTGFFPFSALKKGITGMRLSHTFTPSLRTNLHYAAPTTAKMGLVYMPMLVIIGVYWYLLNSVPRGASPLVILWDEIGDSSAMFLQTLVYPIMGAYRRLTLADEHIPTIWLLGIVTLILSLAFVLWHSRKMGLVALYGLVWFVVASMPTVLFLETDYVRGSWRLMLFGAIGASLFWTMVLGALWQKHRLWRMVAIGIILWGGVMSLDFLNQRKAEALLQADYNDALQAQIQTYTQGRPLVVNAPSFLASTSDQQWLPTRQTGVMFHADYVNHAQVFRAQTGIEFPRIETLINYDIFGAPITQNFAPYTTLHGISRLEAVRNATDIYVTIWEGEEFRPMFVGGMGYDGSGAPIGIFPEIAIVLTEATATRLAPTLLQYQTRWQVDVPPSAQIFLVLDAFCDGQVVGQAIGTIWGGMYPFEVWDAGEIQTDFREVRLLQDVPDDCLALQVSLIDINGDGTPFAVQSPNGTPYDHHRVPVALKK